MHIELRENLTKVSEDIKQRMYGQLNKAWNSLAEFTKLPRVPRCLSDQNNLISSNLNSDNLNQNNDSTKNFSSSLNLHEVIVVNIFDYKLKDINVFNFQNLNETSNKYEKPKIIMGKVNKGRRIDYVLQG